MAVLSLASAGRYLITWLFSNMPGGHSRSHFSERFGFHPELWVRTQGFQKDAAEKVKLSRNPLYKYWWGSCGECHGVERCYFHLKNATRKELNSFENPVMFGGAKHLRTWCRVVKHFIDTDTAMKPLWKDVSLQQMYICTYMASFGAFPVILTSSPLPGISQCTLTISLFWQDQAVGSIVDHCCRQCLVQCSGNLVSITCSCLKAEGVQDPQGASSAVEY